MTTSQTLEQHKGLGLLSFWWACVDAAMELENGHRLPDSEVVLHYVGNGATAMVTAGDIRAVCSLYAGGGSE